MDTWLGAADYGPDRPDFTLWPWQAPPPPDVPREVLWTLQNEARTHGPFSGAYASWTVRVLLAAAFRSAIEEHEAAKDEDA